MTYYLAGDIGGTSARLRAIDRDRQIRLERVYESQNYPDLVPILREFTAELGVVPLSGCLAIAGAVVDGESYLPNLGWHLSALRLALELGMERVELINDFVAIGYGIASLTDRDLHVLQSVTPKPQGAIATIGAGTGLGQGFAVHDGDRYIVMPTEGGHADFAAHTPLEFALIQDMCQRLHLDRISGDRLISGQGIISIYQFLRDRQVAPENPDLAAAIRAWEQNPDADSPTASISRHAIDGNDVLSLETMKMFLSAYGAEAGNLALKILPSGGLYLAGGIAAKNLPLFDRQEFLHAFRNKGRVSDILLQIPVAIILDPFVGLSGATTRAIAP
jgi:glucokinase